MHNGFVQSIADEVAEVLGLDIRPEFVRWTKHRGHATKRYYSKENVFVLPQWLKNENRFCQIAYISHEVAHFVDMNSNTGGHTPKFYEAERKALAHWDLEPYYPYGKRYAEAYYILGTKVPVWTKSTAVTKLRSSRLGWGEGR